MSQTNQNHPLAGVYSAVITPLNPDLTPDLEGIPGLLDFLAGRGCHGVLIMGTTGEGPSFSPEQRFQVYQAALQIRQLYPEFRLFAGTGTPSLDETIHLTRMAFDLGMDGVVVLPPYYFRKAEFQGLFDWFSLVLEKAVPEGGQFFGYHIPDVSGVPFSIELLARLKSKFPNRFTGIKDSSSNTDFAQALGSSFGKDLAVFTGNDRLLSFALENQAAGCITACANLISPDLRKVWDAFQHGKPDRFTQEKINQARQIIERYPPLPPMIKALLAELYGFPHWAVCPPLQPAPPDNYRDVINQLDIA
jgi:4-hydroxy-tetrahydrodipicolinate synthase